MKKFIAIMLLSSFYSFAFGMIKGYDKIWMFQKYYLVLEYNSKDNPITANAYYDYDIYAYSINETEKKNGYTYDKVEIDLWQLDANEFSFEDLAIKKKKPVVMLPQIVLIREKNNCWYAEYDSYAAVANEFYNLEEENISLPIPDENNEILLYDFNDMANVCKANGEHYRIRNISETTTEDNKVRKVFNLTCGLTVVEGIGCINSPEHLIFWQLTDNTSVYATQSLGKSIFEMNCCSYAENESWVYINNLPAEPLFEMNITNTTTQIPTITNGLFDIVGRRLTERPKQGIFIENGRKIVK